MSNKVSVTSEVMDERSRQDAKWGGASRDDRHGPAQWLTLIYDRLDLADQAFGEDYRTRLLQVAALAVAAIESFDRQNEL